MTPKNKKNAPPGPLEPQISVSNKSPHRPILITQNPPQQPQSSSSGPLRGNRISASSSHPLPQVKITRKIENPTTQMNQMQSNQRLSSSSPTTEPDAHNKNKQQQQQQQQEDFAKAADIMHRLAMRKFHLPGNNLCQDWLMYIQNNHLVFGLFCYHRLSPLRLGQRMLLLFGSIAFGLIVTSFTTLYFAYIQRDMNTALICVKLFQKTDGTLGSVTTNVDASQDQLCRIKVTWGMVTLWTLGGVLHALFDQCLWFMSACCCCLPGAIFGNHRTLQKVGSVAVLFIVAIMIAIATFACILRAKYEARKEEILAGISSSWEDPDSFSFALGYLVEQLLVWFIYYFIFVSILFSGVLACGRLPIIGGRPFEMRVEKWQLERERKKLQELSTATTASMSSDENDTPKGRMTYIRAHSNQQDVECLFCDLEGHGSMESNDNSDTTENRMTQDKMIRKKRNELEYGCEVAVSRKKNKF